MAAVAASIAAAGCAGALGVAAGVACTVKEIAIAQLRAPTLAPAPAPAAGGHHTQDGAPAPDLSRRGSIPAVDLSRRGGIPGVNNGRRSSLVLEDDDAAGWEGFTMEEARALADARQEESVTRSPKEVLGQLQRGNARFWMGNATRPEKSAFERRALISKQFPATAILSCSDSRVPTEIVFDQSLGDMFVVRVAGNAVTQSTCASLQYAVHHLKVKVLIVMGHEACGAVKAAALPSEALQKESPELCQVLHALKSGLDFKRLACVQDPRAHDREAVVANVKSQVQALTRDERIMEKVNAKELLIVGAFYEISSGIVDFFYEVSDSADILPSRGVQSVYNPAAMMERQASGAEIPQNMAGGQPAHNNAAKLDNIKMQA